MLPGQLVYSPLWSIPYCHFLQLGFGGGWREARDGGGIIAGDRVSEAVDAFVLMIFFQSSVASRQPQGYWLAEPAGTTIHGRCACLSFPASRPARLAVFCGCRAVGLGAGSPRVVRRSALHDAGHAGKRRQHHVIAEKIFPSRAPS